MAFLHCHDCNWSQDDFWSDSYNPITFLEKTYTKDLLTKDLDEVVEMDVGWLQEQRIPVEDGNAGPTRRELIAWELERHANAIRNMKYRTYEEFEKRNLRGLCPMCGGFLDVD